MKEVLPVRGDNLNKPSTTCIILAGGRGTRMRSNTTHKVCFPIAGRPAILRSLDTYTSAGINNFSIVVGAMAGQVVETVGQEYPEVTFVYQPQQLGTGNATRIGVAPLEAIGYDGNILVTMGDKLIEASAIRKLMKTFTEQQLDMVVGVLPCRKDSSGGRIIQRADGRLAGIVETRDVQKAAILEEAYRVIALGEKERAAAFEALAVEVEKTIPNAEKRRIALGPLAAALSERDIAAVTKALHAGDPEMRFISLGKNRFTAAQAAEACYENAALYLFKAPALYEGLKWITADNAQKEEYLTDAVNYLANAVDAEGRAKFAVGYAVLNPEEVLTYNNPEELLAVEEAFRRRHAKIVITEKPALPKSRFRPVRAWLQLLEHGGQALDTTLNDIYGADKTLHAERIAAFVRVLRRFCEFHGYERKVILVRAPGRVNLMGRHVEHRGGNVNVMAINKETVLVAAPREDDVVNISNTDSARFPERQFDIGKEVAGLPWDDWLNYIDHERVQNLVKSSGGDWVNYVKAAFLRLQFQFKNVRLRGIDAVYEGNIPIAAGLSSSSALVVATAEAAAALNEMDVTPQDFVDLCGEGEWYVGSRGGAGDHAAMKFGRRGAVTQIGFFPFKVGRAVPFPDEYRLVVANSHIKAQKMTNAKDTFNQRVASYEFGLMLLKEAYPQWAERMARLRDVNPETLGVRPSVIYQMLLGLPERMTPAEVWATLGGKHAAALERICRSHAQPEEYLIRSVVLYGIAECARARMCLNYLEKGDIVGLGRLMQISHDGDRVSRLVEGEGAEADGSVEPSASMVPYDYNAPDSYLQRLIEDLQSEDPERVAAAQIHLQPGGYACSTSEIDGMVDVAGKVPGVVGAQLSGAGLGGCVMVLVHRDSVEALQQTLAEKYYYPRRLEPDITVCVPVKGSGLLDIATGGN